MGDKALAWLRMGAVIMFLAAILGGLLLPVYADEIGWRFQERAALDGVDKLFSEACGPNTLAVPPFFMMPARWYSALFNTLFAAPYWIRISGVLYALGLALLVWKLIARVAADRRRRDLLVVLAAGLMMGGLMPLLLVWSRPEQPVLLAIAGAMLIALSGGGDRAGRVPAGSAWLRLTAIVLLACVALSYHMKGLFGLPVFGAAILLCARGRGTVAARAAGMAFLLAATGWALHYWSARLACPADDVLREIYAAHNLGTELAGGGLQELAALAGRLAGNASLLSYVALIAPNPSPMSDWLVPGQISAQAGLGWARGLALLWLAVLLAAAWRLLLAALEAVRERRIEPAAVLSGCLFVTAIGWSALQVRRNTYEAGFVLPLLMMAVVLALSVRLRRDDEGAANRRAGHWLAPWLSVPAIAAGAAGILSVPAVGAIYGPSLVGALSAPAYILPQQRYSLSLGGYGAAKEEIRAAARLCGIPPAGRARALMVDDLTYLAYVRSHLPQHRLGVVGEWRGRIDDPVAYLKSRGSDGIIVGCHVLPDALRSRARTTGRFCCMGPATGW